ncbi:peptidoglycan D,D-transpeptidase FtsI family protein [Armatimonas sp.]|uniref:peptidoglycan D,D-transpeptidase FtsI family protein n=1 Tax=Armatimonas sp. TaxID=1872638 RepID=UPI00374CCB91
MATPTQTKCRSRRETPAEFERCTSSRLNKVALVLAAAHIFLLGRLAVIQIGRTKELTAESLTRWRAPRTLPPTRGLIYDRSGALLVQNEPGFAVVVDPNRWFVGNSTNPKAKDLPEDRRAHALRVLGRFFPAEKLAWISQLDMSRHEHGKRLPTREVVRWVPEATIDQLRQVTVNLAPPIPASEKKRKGALALPQAELPGVSYPASTRRRALNGELAAHVLGFTEESGEHAWRGVELSQQNTLRGQTGKVSYAFDRMGMIPGSESIRQKLIHGSHLYLTLDAELQHDVEQALGAAVHKHAAEAGVAIVLDVHNGDVLAMASAPNYNTNTARTPDPTQKTDISTRNNWAVQSIYEPGSTLKSLTLAAALEEHEVTLNSQFYCNGARKIAKDTIHCAAHGEFQHGHGTQSLIGVLSHSCNLATAECGARLGDKKLHQYLQDFGIGEKTKVGLPSEAPGALHDPNRKLWSQISLANVSFGQGVSVTPLQLAAAYTVFADGRFHAPRLVRAVRAADTDTLKEAPIRPTRRVLSEDTAAKVRQMLGSAVEEGTGQPAQVNGYTAGGKTGTAQMAKDGYRGYSKRFVASFVGLVPLKDPQFVILTMIRDPKKGDHFGGSVAGPIFKEIAERALLLRRVPRDSPLTPKNKKRGKVNTAEG